MYYIHRKTPVLDSLFNKFAVLQVCKFIKKKLQHRFFPENIAKCLRTVLFVEHLWRLLLKRSYRISSQGFCILMSVYEFFNFSTLRNISQYGNTWATHLHYNWPSCLGKKPKFISTTWLQKFTLTNRVTSR